MASAHNGGAGVEPAREHNRREEGHYTNNVDPKGLHETIIDRNLDEVMEETFGKALEEFNAKQIKQNHHSRVHDLNYYYDLWNRAETKTRKKDGKRFTIKNQLERENIIYFTDMEPKDAQLAAHKYIEMLQDKCGDNMIITGAYFHADERRIDPETGETIWNQPHLHLDYIMVAHNQKRGLSTACSIRKGIEELCEKHGITKTLKDENIQIKQNGKREYCIDNPDKIEKMTLLDAFTSWTLSQLDEICAEKGIYSRDYEKVIHQKSKGTPWLSKEEYIEVKEREKATGRNQRRAKEL